MTALLAVEVRRALARRLVRGLVLLALGATVTMGVIVFANAKEVEDNPVLRRVEVLRERDAVLEGCTNDAIVFEGVESRQEATRLCARMLEAEPVQAVDPDDPAYLVNLWPEEGDGLLLIAGTLLPLGALLAAGSLIGAEWSTGTVTTLLTWEPRRGRLLGTKFAAAGVLAALIAAGLAAAFAAAFLPTVYLKGSTTGADGEWLVGAVGAVGRIAVVTGLSALLGAALASVARNTGFAIGVGLGYLAVVEPIMRGLRPRWADWYLAENIGRFITARPLSTSQMDSSTFGALLHLVVYVGLVAALGLWLFRRRDVAAT